MSDPLPAEGPDIEAALAGLPPELLQQLEIVINPDGSVTFVDFPPGFLEVARALNPDDPLVCERTAIAKASGSKP
jgi:hypothetical protein